MSEKEYSEISDLMNSTIKSELAVVDENEEDESEKGY
jgi:hypothetical protein